MDTTKLCLGTVQLGMNYGIKNELGRQPTGQESFALLEEAITAGIDTFDTASAYGNAEQILGAFGIGKYPVKIISKLALSPAERQAKDIAGIIEQKIQNSLENLKIQSLDGYLLHEASDFYHSDIMEALQKFKQQKLIQHIGVSIYEETDAMAAVQNECVDYIQIPYNVFDQRLEKTDFFQLAKERNIKVFARSAFLQGLLVSELEHIPKHLNGAKRYLKQFAEICREYNFSRKEGALLFSCSHCGIDKIVFGVDTLSQLKTNLKIISKFDQFNHCNAALKKYFCNESIDRRIMLPNLWGELRDAR